MLGDELVGYVVEIVANNVRLRANSQDIVAGTLDQRRFPARCHGAESIPRVAGDQAKLGGLNSELSLDVGISLA